MFNVVAGPDRRRAGRKIAFLLLSLGAHVLVLGSLLGASLLSVGESPEPLIPIVFFPGPSAPPPPLGTQDGGDKLERRSRPESRKPEILSPPRVIPPLALPPEEPISLSTSPQGSSDLESTGISSTGPKGDPRGIPGGTGEAPTERPGNGVFTIGAPGVDPPVLLLKIAPEYPEAARRLRLQGIVVVSAVIEADGSVDELTIVHTPSPLLVEPALSAIGHWRYRPATISGRAVRVILDVQIDFSLH